MSGSWPQVRACPPTVTVLPSKFEQPHPLMFWFVRKHAAPVVLKLPVLLVNVTGLVQVPPVPPPLNVAVTLRAAVIDNTHEAVPEQAPLHPPNVDPVAAAAVSVTEVPVE